MVVIDSIEIVEATGHIQVRTVSPSGEYHRHVLAPGDDLSGEHPEVATLAQEIWTPEVIASYQALIANSTPNNTEE